MSITGSVIIPPPPYQSPFVNQQGLLSPIWSKWIQQIYLRSGGPSSPSTAGIVSAITTLQSNVAVNSASITSLNTLTATLSSEIQGLSVGRQL